MTDEILEMMNERMKFKWLSEEYQRKHREIGKKCNESKEAWINDQCLQVEQLIKRHSHKEVHKKMKT